MRDHLLAKEAKSVEYFVVGCRPDGTQQNGLLDPEGFVEFEKADAVSGVPTQNFVPSSRTSSGVGSPGCGPLARRRSRAQWP